MQLNINQVLFGTMVNPIMMKVYEAAGGGGMPEGGMPGGGMDGGAPGGASGPTVEEVD